MAHAFLGAPKIAVIQRCKKIPFPTREAAMKRMKRMRDEPHREVESTTGKLNVYLCVSCPNTWHIGHGK